MNHLILSECISILDSMMILGSSHYILQMTGPPMCWNYVHLSFFFFLRHAGFTSLNLNFFPLDVAIFTENVSIFPFLFFFPPTTASQEILFLFFALRHRRKTPVGIRHPYNIMRAALLTIIL